MSRRTSAGSDEPKKRPKLTVARTEAEQLFGDRMALGDKLRQRHVANQADLDQFQDDMKIWNEYNVELLYRLFDTEELSEEYSAAMSSGAVISTGAEPPSRWYQRYLTRLARCIQMLESIRARLPLYQEQIAEVSPRSNLTGPVASHSRKVFVVHGRDNGTKETVARLLERLDLVPVVLHEQTDEGRTIIEKIEAHADVSFAVVLLTPDDEGRLVGTAQVPLMPRARQNVLWEWGYFVAKLGRKRVCALVPQGVEMPSDLHGVIHEELDSKGNWRVELAKEIRAAGLVVDMNKLFE